MFKELENLVYSDDEQMMNIKENTATIGIKGVSVKAKVVKGQNLEEILNQYELVR